MDQDAVRQNLLDRLLDAVKQCQVYFGARQEIATEVEPRVSTLCTEWEAVLTHGLYRVKPKANLIRPVPQQLKDTAGCLWPLAKLCMSTEEETRLLSLSHIRTDVGRGRAWLRAALNERIMERCLHTIATKEDSLRTLYEPHAFLLDQDRASTLPNMAAGLSSVVFSITFDAQYLDSPRRFVEVESHETATVATSPHESSDCASTPDENDDDGDEVVAVRVPKERKKESGHRRRASSPVVLPQNKAPLAPPTGASTLAPPTGASTLAPPTDASPSAPLTTAENSRSGIAEEPPSSVTKAMETVQSTRRLLMVSQISEQQQCAGNGLNTDELREALLMMMKSRDELAENNRQFEKRLLTEVTKREQLSSELEALRVQQQTLSTSMQALERENDRLHEQLKKYVGIVQTQRKESVLMRSVDSSSEAVALDQNSSLTEPDAVDTSLEQQLCNMAQMYGELMEFNERLQKEVASKESIIVSLKASLRSRGLEVPHFAQPKIVKKTLEVWIPYVVRKEENSESYHTYQVRVKVGDDEWSVHRRYAEFREFHSQLVKVLPEVGFFEFPPKKTLGSKSVQVVEERRQRLQEYLKYVFYTCCTTVISRRKGKAPEPVIDDQTVSKADLIDVLPFFKEDEALPPESYLTPTYSGL